MKDPLKLPLQSRGAEPSSISIRKDANGTTRFAMSLSSEYPVQRWWGTEILSHAADAVRLDRADAGAMPLLWNHNPDDPVGMIDSARLVKGRLEIEGSFFGTQRAQDVATMVAGGLRNVSVGYRIHAVEENVDEEEFTVTDWEPYEGSIAPVPADPTVGVDRASSPQFEVRVFQPMADPPPDSQLPSAITEARRKRASSFSAPAGHSLETSMPDANNAAAGANAGNQTAAPAAGSEGNRSGAAEREPRITTPAGPSAMELEQMRIHAIDNLCKSNNFDQAQRQRWVSSGMSFDKVSDEMVQIMEARSKANPQKNIANLDLSANEVQRFSTVRAIKAIAQNDWRGAGFEAECSRTIAERLNRTPDAQKFFIPYDIQRRAIPQRALMAQDRALNLAGAMPWQTRADISGTLNAGGYLVATDNVGFIELLRNRSVAFRLGARPLSGLVGNVNVPKQSAAATGYWLTSETNQITESDQTFGQMTLTPKTIGAYTEISRLLLLQSSPDVEGIVNADLATVTALGIDTAALNGPGTGGQPLGIINTSGVGTASGMATIAYAGQLNFQVSVANANVVPVAGAYATTPTVAALLMQRTRFANTATPLWDGNLWDANGALGCAGFPGMSSKQIPAGDMIFGDWNSLIIAEWGVLEIDVNPVANFQAGIIGIRAMMTCDIGLRYAGAFCLGTSIT